MKTFAEKIIDSMVDENGHCGERGLSSKQFDVLYRHLRVAETIDRGGWNGTYKFIPFSEDIWEGIIGRYKVKLSCYHHFNERCSVVSIDKWIEELPTFEDSCFVGEPKQRIECDVTLVGESSYEREGYLGGWETVYVYKFADEDENMLVWKTTSSLGYWNEDDIWIPVFPGETIKLRGTVKQHNVYGGVMQTILNRCKVIGNKTIK